MNKSGSKAITEETNLDPLPASDLRWLLGGWRGSLAPNPLKSDLSTIEDETLGNPALRQRAILALHERGGENRSPIVWWGLLMLAADAFAPSLPLPLFGWVGLVVLLGVSSLPFVVRAMSRRSVDLDFAVQELQRKKQATIRALPLETTSAPASSLTLDALEHAGMAVRTRDASRL